MEFRKVDYSEIAQDYDRVRMPNKPNVQWWVARLADAGALAPGKRLLDVACGTKAVTRKRRMNSRGAVQRRQVAEAIGFRTGEGVI